MVRATPREFIFLQNTKLSKLNKTTPDLETNKEESH